MTEKYQTVRISCYKLQTDNSLRANGSRISAKVSQQFIWWLSKHPWHPFLHNTAQTLGKTCSGISHRWHFCSSLYVRMFTSNYIHMDWNFAIIIYILYIYIYYIHAYLYVGLDMKLAGLMPSKRCGDSNVLKGFRGSSVPLHIDQEAPSPTFKMPSSQIRWMNLGKAGKPAGFWPRKRQV